MGRLPMQFEMRFVAARVLWFLPALVAVGGLGWMLNSRLWPLLLAKYLIALGLIGWTSYRKAAVERFRIEDFAREGAEVSPVDKVSSHAVPLLVAVAAGGGLWALIRGDVRWMYLALGLGLLFGMGLVLSWLVYERWVLLQLRTL